MQKFKALSDKLITTKMMKKAMVWLQKVANKNASAQRELACLYQHYHNKEDEVQMKYWILKAIQNFDEEAKRQYNAWQRDGCLQNK